MPRPPKPSLYAREGVWHYRFTCAGERQRGSTGQRDHGRAEKVLARIWYEAHQKAGRALPGAGPVARLDLADIYGLWIARLELESGERNHRYVERHKQAIKLALRKLSRPGDVTNERWQAAMRELKDEGSGWRTLQIATYSLRLLCRFAVSIKAMHTAPELSPPPPRFIARGQAPRRSLTESERDRMLKALVENGDDRAARIWTVMAYTGLRRGELERLTTRWIDPKAKTLRVPATAAKSGEEEEVPLHETARKAIRAEAKARKVRAGDPVFGKNDIRRAFRRALKRSKVDPHALTVYHSARHTFGTLLAHAARGDVSAVMAGGRWRSLSMAQRYVHASAERARAAMKRL